MNQIKNSLSAFDKEIHVPHLLRCVFSSLIFALFCLISVASSRAETINFDGFSGMANSPGSTVPLGSRLSNQLASSGVIFRSGSSAGYVAIVNIGVGHATSGSNAIGGVNANGGLQYNVPIWIDFVLPSDPSQMAITNSVSIRGDTLPAFGTITLEAFDINGLLLGSDTRTDTGGTTLSFSMPGIHSVRISQSRSDVALDDLSFNTPTAAVPTVTTPEPTTMLLLGTGLAGIGGMLRHRRRRI